MEDSFPGGSTFIKQVFVSRGVLPGAIATTLASLSESIIKQYTKPLRSWWLYCKSSCVLFYSPSPTQFLEFLSQELEQANLYSTIIKMRSAISLISNNEIENHALIKRFCKGVGSLKPPCPRYDYVWDPAPVLAKLSTFYPYVIPLPLDVL